MENYPPGKIPQIKNHRLSGEKNFFAPGKKKTQKGDRNLLKEREAGADKEKTFIYPMPKKRGGKTGVWNIRGNEGGESNQASHTPPGEGTERRAAEFSRFKNNGPERGSRFGRERRDLGER